MVFTDRQGNIAKISGIYVLVLGYGLANLIPRDLMPLWRAV